MTPLLSVENLTVAYRVRTGVFASKPLRALTAVSFSLRAGETLSIVGESGCGKSTLARAVLRLLAPRDETAGRVTLDGEDLSCLPAEALRARRRSMQMVFQDPLASLNPRMTAGRIVAEPLSVAEPRLTADERRARAVAMLEQTGLPPAAAHKYPHEFSGGQAQRIGIARALITAPRLLVCDEPVSALDVSVQAQILNLLADLRAGGLAQLFITHDLSVARAISDRVLVLYLGRVMEVAPAAELFANPRHPYTQGLLASAPPPTPQAARAWQPPPLTGEPPSPLNPPSGCVFRLRCPRAAAECAQQIPPLETTADGRQVACIKWRPPRHAGSLPPQSL